MTWLPIIIKILEIVVFPLLGVLTSYMIAYIRTKIKNNMVLKYIDMLDNTIQACVDATNQTFVGALKEAGEFDQKAQEQAFNKTYAAVKNLLTAEGEKYLNEAYGDVETLIKQKIEATIIQGK